MVKQELPKSSYISLLYAAFKEDLDSEGDVTSKAIFGTENCHAELYAKQSGLVCGVNIFREAFSIVDSKLEVQLFFHDGEAVNAGDIVAELRGKTVSVLSAERTAINFLAFLSGIATQTRELCAVLDARSKTVILDTRKTLPGYRALSKYAVRVGGGQNHRIGLYDMVMIKDNHIDAAGSIHAAVSMIRKTWGKRFKIEVECRTLEEVEEAVHEAVDIIMLDNMDTEMVSKALLLKSGSIKMEASGNMDKEKIKDFAPLGLDYISVGALTHSVKAMDYSLKIKRD